MKTKLFLLMLLFGGVFGLKPAGPSFLSKKPSKSALKKPGQAKPRRTVGFAADQGGGPGSKTRYVPVDPKNSWLRGKTKAAVPVGFQGQIEESSARLKEVYEMGEEPKGGHRPFIQVFSRDEYPQHNWTRDERPPSVAPSFAQGPNAFHAVRALRQPVEFGKEKFDAQGRISRKSGQRIKAKALPSIDGLDAKSHFDQLGAHEQALQQRANLEADFGENSALDEQLFKYAPAAVRDFDISRHGAYLIDNDRREALLLNQDVLRREQEKEQEAALRALAKQFEEGLKMAKMREENRKKAENLEQSYRTNPAKLDEDIKKAEQELEDARYDYWYDEYDYGSRVDDADEKLQKLKDIKKNLELDGVVFPKSH